MFSGHGEQAAGGREEHCGPHQWAAEDSGAEETGDSWTGPVSNDTPYIDLDCVSVLKVVSEETGHLSRPAVCDMDILGGWISNREKKMLI